MSRHLAGLLALIATSAGCIGGDEPVDSAVTNETEESASAAAGAPVVPPAEPPASTTMPQVALEVSSDGFYPVNPTYTLSQSEIASGSVVTVTYTNRDLNPLGTHDWVLEGVEGAGTAQIGVGEEAQARFVAPAPGDYTYFCSVPGHRDRGMEGVLTITAA